MRTERIGLAPVVLARNQVNRVLAHAVPRSRKWKIGTGKFLEAEHTLIKLGRAFGIGDAHRAMAEAFDLDHRISPRRATADFAALHGARGVRQSVEYADDALLSAFRRPRLR